MRALKRNQRALLDDLATYQQGLNGGQVLFRSTQQRASLGPEDAPYHGGDNSFGLWWLKEHDPLSRPRCRAGIHPKPGKGECKLCRLERSRRYHAKERAERRRQSPVPYEDAIIALELSGSKQYGSTWQCPNHEDRKPSMSITRGRNGNAIVYCHAGCTWQEVLAALAA